MRIHHINPRRHAMVDCYNATAIGGGDDEQVDGTIDVTVLTGGSLIDYHMTNS
jgi:hypothetical protein